MAQRKKTALTAELLKDVLHRLDDSLRGRRDRALLLLTFAGGFRRSASPTSGSRKGEPS